MSKIPFLIITLGLVIGLGIILYGSTKSNTAREADEAVQNVEMRDGIQYITIEANGGYYPKNTDARAGVPTHIIVKTNSTYDCSSALVIRDIGYQKMLPGTGEEIIDIGTPVAGKPLVGTCSMGMYSFKISFR